MEFGVGEAHFPAVVAHYGGAVDVAEAHIHLLTVLGITGALDRQTIGNLCLVEQGSTGKERVIGGVGGGIAERGWIPIDRKISGAQGGGALLQRQRVVTRAMGINAGFGHHRAPTAIALGRDRGQDCLGDQQIQLLACHALRHRTSERDAVGVGGFRQAEAIVAAYAADRTDTVHLEAAAGHRSCRNRVTHRIGDAGVAAVEFEHQAAQTADLAHGHVVVGGNTVDGIHGLHTAHHTAGCAGGGEADVGGIGVAHRLREADAEGLHRAVTFAARSLLDRRQHRPHTIDQHTGAVCWWQRSVHIHAHTAIAVGEAAAIGEAQAGRQSDAAGAAQITVSDGVDKGELITGGVVGDCVVWRALQNSDDAAVAIELQTQAWQTARGIEVDGAIEADRELEL